MIWAVLAAQLSAPVPIDFLKWWSPDDMPAYHQRNGVTRWLTYRVTVSPIGAIQSCEIETSSTDTKLDNLSCAIIRKRGRLKPAARTDGAPVSGVYRHWVIWAVGDSARYVPPDIVVPVKDLREKVRYPDYVMIDFAVDEHGKISECGTDPENKHPKLVEDACRAVMNSYKATPAKGADGYAVMSVQNATVLFQKQSPRE